MGAKGISKIVLALGVSLCLTWTAQAADTPEEQQAALEQTPPRVSFVDGQVSFWRPGAQDWAPAQVNTPLAPGDELSTGSPGNLELQIGARAFVRTWANSQIGLESQEPDFLQFKMTAGTAAFELRRLESGQTVEVDTPNAALTIEHSGYYRVEVTGERTSVTTRRGGRATLTPASGEAVAITPSEEVVVEGTASPQVNAYAAPPRDDWDKWNYARTESLLDSVSARFVTPGTYGVDDLDTYGTWRDVPTYGPVWVPTGMPAGWVPYSTGSWTQDPSYGWTWVDTAPWGWAPYHHGRWVFVNSFWAWAPGPVLTRPVYAPALVAFFGGPGVRVGIGGSVVGWVPLGWGEPVVPWWGRQGFAHNPWWGGWGGPRVVNNTVISNTTVVNVQSITVYRNAGVQNAVVAVSENRFGRGPIMSARLAHFDMRNIQPIHTGPQVSASPASFVPTTGRGFRPPENVLRRSVVATRPPHSWSGPAGEGERRVGPAGVPAAAPRIVSVPQQRETGPVLPRPQFGKSTVERPTGDRPQSPAPPRSEGSRRGERSAERTSPAPRQAPAQQPSAPQAVSPPPATIQAPAGNAVASPPIARRPEAPQVATPAPGPAQRPAERPQPTAQQPTAPQVSSPAPAQPQRPSDRVLTPVTPMAPATRQAPAQQPTAPRVISPPPAAAQAPAGNAVTPPPTARRPEAPQVATPAPALPQRPAERPQAPSVPMTPITRQAPAQQPTAPQVATPAPAAPQPAARAATALPPSARREAVAPPARTLPGEPANRLAPNRAEARPPQREERKAPGPPARPQGAPEKAPRERGGG